MFYASVLLAFTAVAIYAARKLSYLYSSALYSLPGPKSSSFLFGNLKDIFKADPAEWHEGLMKEYGKTFKYYSIGNRPRLFTADTRAINHILTHSEIYQKPTLARRGLTKALGAGLIVVEGEKHRQQRRIMNPAFGPAQIRSLIPIFNDKSLELRDTLLAQLQGSESGEVDILSWVTRATLDIIGLAGFGYAFNAMKSEADELHKAFKTAFQEVETFALLPILQLLFPIFDYVPNSRDARLARAKGVMHRIGHQLLDERKAAYLDDKTGGSDAGKDLLSLLVKANIQDKQGMTDDDVLAQVPTFLVAGHETTSTAVTWAIYALCRRIDIQSKLREEIYTLSSDNPDADEIKALSFLDAVTKETFRLHSPVPGSIRVAMQDDLIPLEDGNHIRVAEGDDLFVPILLMNRMKEIWGEDSFEFKPERWDSLPKEVEEMPGVWSHLLTFLGGSRACIGFQFSVLETKCLLIALLRSFEFSFAVPVEEIGMKSSIVTRPILKSREKEGFQLPVIIKLHNRA